MQRVIIVEDEARSRAFPADLIKEHCPGDN